MLLLFLAMLTSIVFGYFLYRFRVGTIRENMLSTGLPILILLIIFQIFNIHWNAEEGDYLVITLLFIFYGLNVFQPLRFENQLVGKIVYVICFLPMIVIIPWMLWLVGIQLKWMIQHLFNFNT